MAEHDPAMLPASPSAPPEPERPRGRRRLLIILAAALGGFIACATLALVVLVFSVPTLRSRLAFLSPIAAPPPEAPDKFADPPDGPVRISEDFSGDTRWDRFTTRFADGTYELSLELDNFDSYGLFLGGTAISDFDMAVNATFVAGPPNAEYGIRFRQSAPDDHLLFSISPSGFFRLVRVTDRSYSSLVPWTRDSRIRTGVGATNRLRVVAEGESITGFVNGEEVLRYTDPEPAPGQLTLGLVTFEQGGLTVRFDDVEGFALGTAPDSAQPTRLDLNQQFDEPTPDWSVGGATLRGGAYEMLVAGRVASWQQPLPTGSSEVQGDFAVEVEATMLSGNVEGAGNGYGLMFADNGQFEFFYLLILPEGGLTLLRNGSDGGFVVEPTPVPVVNAGTDATNKIRLEVRGQNLAISINDEAIGDIDFPATISLDGMVGLLVQSADAEGVEVRFDNFVLEELVP
jgi:hypothetical protein